MTNDDIQKILAAHAAWLCGETGGVRADLRVAIFIRGNKPLTVKQYNARLRAEEKDRLMAADKATARYIKDVKRLMDYYG